MTDIAELFAKDPLQLTQDDISAIIERYRKARSQFNAGNLKAGSAKPPSAKTQAALKLSDQLGIDLGDL